MYKTESGGKRGDKRRDKLILRDLKYKRINPFNLNNKEFSLKLLKLTKMSFRFEYGNNHLETIRLGNRVSPGL